MLKPLALVLTFFLLGVSGAFAASFDCAKASTAFEKVICDQPELSALDETLAQAYATAIGGLSKPAVEVMRRNQRQWLEYAQRNCSETGELPPAYGEDDFNCLHSELYNRIRALEASRMIAGWRFYLDETFKVKPTTSTDPMARPETTTVSSPRIDGTDAIARAFNAYVAAAADRFARAAKAETSEEPPDPSIDEGMDTAITITVESAQPNRISLRGEDSFYGHGAAHGNYTVTYPHFLTREGRALEAADIFAGAAWPEHLAALAIEDLKARLGEGMWNDIDDDIAQWVTDPARWNFTDDGLEVQFQPYEVTAYAAGAPRATIAWEKLEGDLASGASSLTY